MSKAARSVSLTSRSWVGRNGAGSLIELSKAGGDQGVPVPLLWDLC